jgi:three-Cys-motif partner protein
MPLTFHNNAICLSGLAGTKLKCDVIRDYYPFWWKITSGGHRLNYQNPTAIIEMNAASGEVFLEDSKETVLGSAGHALELKANSPDTYNLKIVLIESNRDCFDNLEKVIARRWPAIDLNEAKGPIDANTSGIFLLNKNVDDAINDLNRLYLGNSLFFFDPLRSVEYSILSQVAMMRMPSAFKTGTEYFIFSFTSDWCLGRNDFPPLPTSLEKDDWTTAEARTVKQADELFGSKEWRKFILTERFSNKQKQIIFMQLYKNRLHRWFRYVLALPFNPKENQLFHLILCSNYEAGVRRTNDAYTSITGNPRFSPNNKEAIEKFRALYPKLFTNISGNRRPVEWKILWKIIRQPEEGLCDFQCHDLMLEEPDSKRRIEALHWLLSKDYLKVIRIDNAWKHKMRRYTIQWNTVKDKLGVDMPPKLRPISPQQLKLRRLLNADEE